MCDPEIGCPVIAHSASQFKTATLRTRFAGQVGDHVLEVAGLHGFRHVVLGLFDTFVGHFGRDDHDADLIGMFFDERRVHSRMNPSGARSSRD